MNKTTFTNNLLSWYDKTKRSMPFRENPNPYYAWISEIMLQQTRVETVIPYFNRFVETLPTIKHLAEVEDDVLHKLWEGLGYYSRARNLKKAAIKVMQEFNGELPDNQSDLEALPGIGPYTSGALLSIAFNQRYTAVDGNVLRVFARLLGIKENIKSPHIKKSIKNTVESLLPDNRIGDFNQALMEVGALVCLPNGQPRCMVCPLQDDCIAFNQNLTNEIPVKQPKKKRKLEQRTVFIIQYKNQYVIHKRPNKGLLADLYEFPNKLGHISINEVRDQYPTAISVQKIAKSKHVFSHLEWHMIGYHITLSEPPDGQIASIQELQNKYSIPTAFKAYKSIIEEDLHE